MKWFNHDIRHEGAPDEVNRQFKLCVMEAVIGRNNLRLALMASQVVNKSQIHVVDASVSNKYKLIVSAPERQISHAPTSISKHISFELKKIC